MKEKCYNISDLTKLIKLTLEENFFNLYVEGEISNFRPSSTGHYYFTLKDKSAVISAVMFKNRINSLNFEPSDGQLVRVRGNISVYAQRGSYQIIVEQIEKAGIGDILAMLEERKKQLAAQGYFETSIKKQIPMFPSKVGVITSPTGAALRDILRVLKRRNSGLNLIIHPTPVQGVEAAKKIAEMIKTANTFNLCDVIILARGGGSIEDLLPFSEEVVVKAIFNSKIPIISGIGHEIDTSLADLAADKTAPTPSAAAEIVSINKMDLYNRITETAKNLTGFIKAKLENKKLILDQFKVENIERNFRIQIQPLLMRLDDSKEAILKYFSDMVITKKHKLELLTQGLLNQSPEGILQKGYAIITDYSSNKVIKKASAAHTGEKIKVRFYKDSLIAEVKEKLNNDI